MRDLPYLPPTERCRRMYEVPLPMKSGLFYAPQKMLFQVTGTCQDTGRI